MAPKLLCGLLLTLVGLVFLYFPSFVATNQRPFSNHR